MWIAGPFIQQAMELIQFWGLKYITMILVWRKLGEDGKSYKGLGKITQHNYEYLALATKGNLEPYLRDSLNLG